MRRNTKTMYEWRKAYRDKEELMGIQELILEAMYIRLRIHHQIHIVKQY